MLRNEQAMVMYVRRGQASLLILLSVLVAAPARAQLIDGLDAYSDAVVGLSTNKWTGPRVPAPVPERRPDSDLELASRAWPVRVHADDHVPLARVESTLRAAEDAFALLYRAGFITSFGDGEGERDLYLIHADTRAGSDASGNFSALDGTRAFAIVDARTPAVRLSACVAQALMEAQLLELDPAEDAAMRGALAMYYGWLVSGEFCADDVRAPLHESPFSTPASAAAWFERLSARQDRNRGTFLFEMWQFARQRTWEGRDLRASPDLLEAIAKALSLAREDFDLVTGELAEEMARMHARTVGFTALPAFPDRRAPPLAVMGTAVLRVNLGAPRPGTRLRAWSRAEGGRYTLSAVRLDALGVPLSRMELGPRKDPNAQLSIELDARTFAVSVALTRVADVGLPDPDQPDLELRHAGLIVDAAP